MAFVVNIPAPVLWVGGTLLVLWFGRKILNATLPGND